MVRKLCPPAIESSNNSINFLNEFTHTVYVCHPKLTEKDNIDQKNKNLSQNTNDRKGPNENDLDVIYGYCKIDNIIFFDINQLLGKKKFDPSKCSFFNNISIYENTIKYNPSESAPVMPSGLNLISFRLKGRELLMNLNLRPYTCTKCNTKKLRNILFNGWEIIRSAIVCLDCKMVYIFDGKEYFVPISLELSPVLGFSYVQSFYMPIKLNIKSKKKNIKRKNYENHTN